METVKRASGKEILGWAMFDFANSSYTTVIVTVVFSVLFPRIIVGDAPDFSLGNFLWSLALAVSNGIVLVCAPFLGAVMDFSAAKKHFLFASCVVTVIATAALYAVSPGDVALAMALVVVSNTAFALSESFVSSFLPSLGPPEDLGKISGYAWGLGYFGGLASTALVLFGLGPLTADNFPHLRFVGPLTGAFFLVASIPTFIWLREPGTPRTLPRLRDYVSEGVNRLRYTMASLRDFRDLLVLLGSYFFAYAGLSIVISFAFIYGDQVVRWSPATQMMMFVITQLTAAAGAVLFGFFQDRSGPRTAYAATLVLWVVTVASIFGVDRITAAVNSLFSAAWEPQHVFLLVGSIAGMGIGSTQSSCRAMIGLLAPQSKSGEFFGIWGMVNRVASIGGLLALGFLQRVFGLKNAILICGIFFIAAFIIAFGVNMNRGREAARTHEGH